MVNDADDCMIVHMSRFLLSWERLDAQLYLRHKVAYRCKSSVFYLII